MQILILGMHRSGTSATARLINMMGAYFAPEGVALPARPENPKGFWERRDVLYLNDELLKLQQCHWNKLANWSFERAAQAPDGLKYLMQNLVMNMDGFRPWFIKDPRMCLTLPAWRDLLEAPVAVMVYRNPHEIALSLSKRNSGMNTAYALALWEYYTVGMLNSTRQIPRIFISYEDMLSAPVKCCEQIHSKLTALGVRRFTIPSAQEVRAFIDPRLYRSKQNDAVFTPAQKTLCDILQGIHDQKAALQVSSESLALMQKGPQG